MDNQQALDFAIALIRTQSNRYKYSYICVQKNLPAATDPNIRRDARRYQEYLQAIDQLTLIKTNLKNTLPQEVAP